MTAPNASEAPDVACRPGCAGRRGLRLTAWPSRPAWMRVAAPPRTGRSSAGGSSARAGTRSTRRPGPERSRIPGRGVSRDPGRDGGSRPAGIVAVLAIGLAAVLYGPPVAAAIADHPYFAVSEDRGDA